MKRAFDILACSLAAIITLPLFVAVAIAIKLSSPGPVLFRQERVGLNGRSFQILKFRTMVVDAPRLGPAVTAADDPRITRIGRLLRNTKLDELPQLLNIIRGEMSLVGPRPEVPRYIAFYPEPERTRILSVRPGLTDYAAIEFSNENELLSGVEDRERVYVESILPKKIALYLRYVEEQSFNTDVRLIIRTLRALIS